MLKLVNLESFSDRQKLLNSLESCGNNGNSTASRFIFETGGAETKRSDDGKPNDSTSRSSQDVNVEWENMMIFLI